MKPREKTEPATYPGFTIRQACADLLILDGLAEASKYPTVNQMMGTMVIAVLDVCENLTVAPSLQERNIAQLNRLLWQLMAERDLRRSLPSSLSKPIKLTLPSEERKRIEGASRRLRWSAGQCVVEALQAYCVIAGAEGQLFKVPDIIRLFRADRSIKGEIEPESIEYILDRLNSGRGLILRRQVEPTHVEISPSSETTIDIDLV